LAWKVSTRIPEFALLTNKAIFAMADKLSIGFVFALAAIETRIAFAVVYVHRAILTLPTECTIAFIREVTLGFEVYTLRNDTLPTGCAVFTGLCIACFTSGVRRR
uniref:TPT domain-containing protein n=1 Tax=Rodentolepis nana TaxID=102285 RepID=A0A158QJ55_RODNA